ncbi:uncharacterized protein LOC100823922 [Brachypodium distachyon]|uniref:Uncharacterized protein n=1 Tax=Brachypodium distachyon TaxID=15368 RepID=A0A2K2CPP0_BRADI|nr:uncharacterized protein LOC100823922 [Brachypodium distachyon]PNT64000.1 hypothetical protein BRADI_4g23345v3 [Brachypodium distachyon]|eukprot:XP_003577746.1 uncharacterized protein LOC100823922 [Brachypodium distachyon]
MAPPQGQQEEQRGRPASSFCVWLVTALLLASVLGGGACLVAYVVLPPGEAPGWIAAAGLALVALPWAFWIATGLYRCVTTRSADRAAAAAVAPGSGSMVSRAQGS